MKTIYTAIAVFVLVIATVIFAQTRRTRDEEFVRKTFDMEELQEMTATIKVCDPDGDPVIIDIDDLPPGAILSDTYVVTALDPSECDGDPNCIECFPSNPNDLATVSWYAADLTWTPTYEQSGEYRLHIYALDNKGGDDWVVYVINVADKNRPPVL